MVEYVRVFFEDCIETTTNKAAFVFWPVSIRRISPADSTSGVHR
ncbi:MAG TPA: hypothetical protein VJ785_13500 [Anaerolineales bacterium]|nr:hypothetical protein [Anaerolineales bacterium]